MGPREGLNLSDSKLYQVALHLSTEANIYIEDLHATTNLKLIHDCHIAVESTAHTQVTLVIAEIHDRLVAKTA
ncbi:hypothetical protein HPB49_008901 [Dermacentor silvarum]|uniref:Uncharacterized protein n=1 Tax=Dermacentor silvarum TaxID=543639 RepID=A0ACB8DJ97_DERSI|nr:hypothetical protein HPB49_008901 [Dermacentor silvarum]